jgi:hypothetical protein
LKEKNFIELFNKNWKLVRDRFHVDRYSVDIWHGCLSLSRQYLRGWNSNKVCEAKRERPEILKRLEILDDISEGQLVQTNHWKERYQLKSKLEHIDRKEELFWQQRNSQKGIITLHFFMLVQW